MQEINISKHSVVHEENYRVFWDKIPENELKEVVWRLMAIIPHSAKCERLFSIMSYIKKKCQGQMKNTSLSAYALIKMRNLNAVGNKKPVDILDRVCEPFNESEDKIGESIDDDLFELIIEDESNIEFLSRGFSLKIVFDIDQAIFRPAPEKKDRKC